MKNYYNSDSEENGESKPKWSGFEFFEDKSISSELEGNSAETQPRADGGKPFPLAMANLGESLLVVKLKGSESIMRRLIGMGLVPGCKVQIISTSNGSVIVAIGDNRVGLGAGMAQKIMCINN
jgi:ferrous iron transport protein A